MADQPMAEHDDAARIRAYLEEHRATYDQAALRAKLLEDGHDVEQIDLAMAQVYGFEVAPASPPPADNSRKSVILIAVGTFLANYSILPVLVIGVLSAGDFGGGSFLSLFSIFGVVPLVLLLEGIAVLLLRRRNATWARGLGWGLVVSLIPLIGLAMLFGICVALISTLGG
jgi:hypothetical protein